MVCFNPRTHTGCDQENERYKFMRLVSIHAPTRGATFNTGRKVKSFRFQSTHPHGVRRNRSKKVTEERSFNPRTHTGCDVPCTMQVCLSVMFQSTHPHGVRRRNTPCRARSQCFNPRTHTGCDQNQWNIDQWNRVSIHAPTRGATNSAVPKATLMYVSIHAPTRGAT